MPSRTETDPCLSAPDRYMQRTQGWHSRNHPHVDTPRLPCSSAGNHAEAEHRTPPCQPLSQGSSSSVAPSLSLKQHRPSRFRGSNNCSYHHSPSRLAAPHRATTGPHSPRRGDRHHMSCASRDKTASQTPYSACPPLFCKASPMPASPSEWHLSTSNHGYAPSGPYPISDCRNLPSHQHISLRRPPGNNASYTSACNTGHQHGCAISCCAATNRANQPTYRYSRYTSPAGLSHTAPSVPRNTRHASKYGWASPYRSHYWL